LNNDQDYEILSALVRADNPMTAYAIGKETGITIPQVRYRLTKLAGFGVVTATPEKNKTVYDIHSILKSMESLEKIACLLTDIISIIITAEEIDADGVKMILAFIVDRIDFEDAENNG